MNNNDVEELAAENERLHKEISYLKDMIFSLRSQLSEARSDLVVENANKRGKP